MRLWSFLVILLFPFLLLGQSQVKYKLESNGGYFYAYGTPADPKGILFLIPDFNQTEEELLARTDIATKAYTHGIVTIIIPYGHKVFADREIVKIINEAMAKSLKSYELPRDKVILGGYGTGGTIALKYGSYCLKFKDDYPFTPAAIYAIESPVDLIQLYESCEREISKNINQEAVLKAKLYKTIMDQTIGGSPLEQAFMYEAFTPYNRRDKNHENIQPFAKTPIRLYNDTDIMWHMSNKRMSAYDMNAAPASEMINYLYLMGNKNAELIKTNVDNKAIVEKKANSRTSVDETDLLLWMLRHLKIN